MFIALLEPIRIRSGGPLARKLDSCPVKSLDGVAQRRTVDLDQDVGADLDAVIGPNPNDVVVERGMVDLAH